MAWQLIFSCPRLERRDNFVDTLPATSTTPSLGLLAVGLAPFARFLRSPNAATADGQKTGCYVEKF